MRKKRAFTLIELLVVVSIIALLVSILMPALGRARKQARKVLCSSNLHSCGMSLVLYANDDPQGRLPARHKDFELRYLLYDPYYLYLKSVTDSEEIYVCPELYKSYYHNRVVTWCAEPERNRTYDLEPHPAEWDGGQGMYLGYSYLGGKKQDQWDWNTLLLDETISRWKSPLKISEKGYLPVMADHIELNGNYVEATHRKGGHERAWLFWLEPEEFDVEGGNVLLLDGSVHWKDVKALKKHPRSNYVGAYSYWGDLEGK